MHMNLMVEKADGPKINQTPQNIMGFVLGLCGDEYAELVADPISQGELAEKSSKGDLHSAHRDAL